MKYFNPTAKNDNPEINYLVPFIEAPSTSLSITDIMNRVDVQYSYYIGHI